MMAHGKGDVAATTEVYGAESTIYFKDVLIIKDLKF